MFGQIPMPVMSVLTRLKALNHQAYLVGGCVRDSLLARTPKDFDVATSARPEQVRAAFHKVIPTGIQHGTVTVVYDNQHVEVTTFRSDGDYQDGRRPQSVRFEDDITSDLARRDFTINAMAFDPVTGTIVDPFGGQRDLKEQIVRCVGNPTDRFAEDGLRPLRAIRFASVLGLSLDKDTEIAISGTLGSFAKISRERVREEFTKILMSDRPRLGLSLLQKTGLLDSFLPELSFDSRGFQVKSITVQRAVPVLEVRLAALLENCFNGKEALRRLTFPTETVNKVMTLMAYSHPRRASDATLRRFLATIGLDLAESAVNLHIAKYGHYYADTSRLLEIRDARPPLTTRDLALDGEAIMKILGIGPSKTVGEATKRLLEAVLDRPELNTVEALTQLLKR